MVWARSSRPSPSTSSSVEPRGSITMDTPKPIRRRGIASPPGIDVVTRPASDTARPASLPPFTTRFADPSTGTPHPPQ
jgi:hypothetical protein